MMEEKEKKAEKELELLKLYLEEIKRIPAEEKGEKEKLFLLLREGDKNAFKRLTELYLMESVEQASHYRNRGIGLADLIQEANLGLVNALAEPEDLSEDRIKESMKHALEDAVSSSLADNEFREHLAEEANRLDEAAREMAEKNGREPTVEELMESLGMTEDEVRSYMKFSLDALNTEL